MKKFLEQTAEKILKKHGNDLSRVLVLTPNQRSCIYFRNALQNLTERSVFAPEISTLQNFLLAQSTLTLADNIELITDLYSCHKQIGGSQTFDEFIGSANTILSDFDELDLQMADTKIFFKNLERLQSMKMWEPGEQPDEYVIRYRKFWEEFGLLYHALREKLFQKRKGYRGMILRDVVENLKVLPSEENLGEAVYLIGFSSLNKTDEVAFNLLKQKRNTEIISDTDVYYVKNELNEAGYFFRKYKTLLGITEKHTVNEISGREKKIKIIGVAKNIGQVKVAADILQNKLQVSNETALETVVVVPDEKLLLPLIAHLPANIEAVNITMGLSIAGSNASSFIEIIFRLFENAQRYKTKANTLRFYYKDVFEFLQHNFFRLLFPKVQTENFVEKMKTQNRVVISSEEIISALGNDVSSIFFIGETAIEFAEFLSSLISNLLHRLIREVQSGRKIFVSEAEITFRLHKIINNTKNIFKEKNEISIKTYIALLRENFRSERVPLEGDPVQGLQIMGLHESRSLDFKNVIILSANEGILPSGKSMNTYIPFEMRAEFLTTYKERDANTAYLFYRLFQKAENIFLLYNTEPDELGGGEQSRFILQLEEEMKFPNTSIEDLTFAVDPPASIGETEIKIQKSEEVMKKLLKLLTEYGMSPSALNTYINCTLQYYFRYVTGLRKEDDMEENLEASTIGSAVHHALEKIYEEKKGKTVEADFILTQSKNKKRIEDLVCEHLCERFDNESLTSGKNLLLFKVCVKLTEEFLKHEAEYLKQLNEAGSNLKIESLEEKLTSEIDIGGSKILVNGRVDRIESINDVIQIADYKTSTRSKKIPVLDEEVWDELFLNPDYSKPVQLLVYAWLFSKQQNEKDISLRSGIYWLKSDDKILETLQTEKGNDIINAETILRFENKLKELLEELLNTSVPFTKTEDSTRCKFCEFAGICQRN